MLKPELFTRSLIQIQATKQLLNVSRIEPIKVGLDDGSLEVNYHMTVSNVGNNHNNSNSSYNGSNINSSYNGSNMNRSNNTNNSINGTSSNNINNNNSNNGLNSSNYINGSSSSNNINQLNDQMRSANKASFDEKLEAKLINERPAQNVNPEGQHKLGQTGIKTDLEVAKIKEELARTNAEIERLKAQGRHPSWEVPILNTANAKLTIRVPDQPAAPIPAAPPKLIPLPETLNAKPAPNEPMAKLPVIVKPMPDTEMPINRRPTLNLNMPTLEAPNPESKVIIKLEEKVPNKNLPIP